MKQKQTLQKRPQVQRMWLKWFSVVILGSRYIKCDRLHKCKKKKKAKEFMKVVKWHFSNHGHDLVFF